MLSVLVWGCGLATLACGPVDGGGADASAMEGPSTETSGNLSGTSSSGEPEQCPPTEMDMLFTARMEPCRDEACDETDPGFWFPSISEPEAAETTLGADCHVLSTESISSTGIRWRLAGCEGTAAPRSGVIVLEIDAEVVPAIDVGSDVQIQIYRRYGAWVFEETRAWAVRSGDGDLLTLFSDDGELPPDDLSAPFGLVARRYCEESMYGGLEGPVELEVSRGGEAVVLTAGSQATLGGSLVVLERGVQASDMPGAYGGWTRLKFLLVAST